MSVLREAAWRQVELFLPPALADQGVDALHVPRAVSIWSVISTNCWVKFSIVEAPRTLGAAPLTTTVEEQPQVMLQLLLASNQVGND